MRFAFVAITAALTLSVGVATAKDGVTNPVVKERMDLMQTIRVNTGALGDMAQGKTAFDAAKAAEAKAALAGAAAMIVAKFTPNEDDPVAEGRPEIWTNFADFTTKAEALVTAAEAVDVASLAGIQGGMGAIGGTCKACHEAYRAKK